MTKRFTMSDDGGVGLWTIYDNGKWLSARVIVECLNNLHEENTHLKQRIEDYNKALKTLQDAYERQLSKNKGE